MKSETTEIIPHEFGRFARRLFLPKIALMNRKQGWPWTEIAQVKSANIILMQEKVDSNCE
jgi:hypothetical protein